MSNLRNAHKFWLLAAEQEKRNFGEESEDEVLCRLLPTSTPPWGRSWCEEAAQTVPAPLRLEFVTAYHWLGDYRTTGCLILPMFQRSDETRYQALEERAALALIGAVTLPPDAPWKKRTWAKTVEMLPPMLTGRAPVVHARLSVTLQSDAHAFRVMRDLYQDHWTPWVWLSEKAIEGLGWVIHDGTEKKTSEDQARAALVELLDSKPAGQEWRPSDIASWAEFCADYVAAYRKKHR